MNIIKTKMGFDTKPYMMPAINFYELLSVSARVYGDILLLVAILLSVGAWIPIKSVHHQQTHQLQSLQQKAVTLEQRYTQLLKEHDSVSSLSQLEALSPKMEMHRPTEQVTLYLPTIEK